LHRPPGLRAVGRLQGVEVALDALLDLALSRSILPDVRFLAAVDRLELAAVGSSDVVRFLPVQRQS
jgi:hypothetical protein